MHDTNPTVDDNTHLGEQTGTQAIPGLLVVFAHGQPTNRLIRLDRGPIELGRAEADGIVSLDDERASRKHARLALEPSGLRITDMGSRNGTFVDGRRITDERFAQMPRVLRIGKTLLGFTPNLQAFVQRGVQVTAFGVIGPFLYEAHQRIARAASSGDSVLLTGPSGAGKELAARRFHDASGRKGPFIAINCATIPSGLAERLLFGARKGAYSGAVTDTEGHVQAADGGTLFLDEVAELDIAVQPKLLRVLETREVMSLGASNPKRVDIRICAATLKDMRTEVRCGRFREDLYFRIGRPEVRLPGLTERLEEIPYLTDIEVKKTHPEAHFTPSFLEACLLRAWPGNVRELLVEVRQAARAALADGRQVVDAQDLSPFETHIAVDRQARYVRIDNPDSLQLAEVEVFRTKNLAYNKPATQSSTDFGGDAWKAVDGNTDGNYGGGSVSHTGWENGWWQVDLQALKNIGYVVVHNRTDCNGNYLHDFTVKISNDGQNWHSIGFQGPASAQVLVPVNREARYVRIENALGYLHMAEVQVFEAQHLPGWAYGRGAGTVPNWHCADGLEYQAGLCYDPCQYDYDGVGFVCWQKCAPDYMDFGATCTNWSTWHTYGKNTYTRAVHGLTATCASDEDLDAGLCYPKCDPGFHGVGPVCWADQIDILSIAQSTCEAFRVPIVSQLAMQSGKTLTAGVGASVSIGAQGTAEVGVAYGSNGEYGCYVTACGGISLNVSINAYASLGTYNSFSSIAGESTVISTGYSLGIPETPISIGGGMGFVLNTQGEQIGTTVSGNVGVGLDGLTPIDFSTLTCHTEVLQTR